MPRPLRFISPLHKAARQIGEYLRLDCAELDLEPGEGHLLSYISHYGPCPIIELVRVFGHRPSTLTGMLDRLEERELIRRLPNPEDRRSVLVRATGAGRSAQAAMRGKLEAVEGEIAARVDARDIAGFAAVMRAIAELTGVELTDRDRPALTAGSSTPAK